MANDTAKTPDAEQAPVEKVTDNQPAQGDSDTPPLVSPENDAAAKTGETLPGPDKPDTSDSKIINLADKSKSAEKSASPEISPKKQAPDITAEDNRPPWEKPLEPEAKQRPPRATKQEKAAKAAEKRAEAKTEKQTRSPRMPGETQKTATVSKEPPAPVEPEPPREAPRSDQSEQIVFISHAELFPFKEHPFQVRDDEAMKSLVESVKERGVDQPAIVRPREGGGYELIAGHRRQKASELAGYTNVPCVVRNLTDDEAVLAMTESNFNQRSEILPSERAKALQMQLEAIKHQGARFEGIASGDVGKRSNEIVAERNQMKLTTVKRYVCLNKLAPELLQMVDDKKISFTPAVELSYIRPKNQKYIAIAIEGQQSSPSLAQAQRMRKLDQEKLLNPDVIDGIMLEEKKEVDDKVIISSQELGQYFGKEVTPREMKDQIMKLLDDWKGQHKELSKPEKQIEPEK